MATNQQKEKSGLFNWTNLIWVLIALGIGLLLYQTVFKSKTEEKTPVTNIKAAPSKGSKVSKHDANYQDYLQPPLGLNTPMTRSGDEKFMEGMDQYLLKQYTNAREYWLDLPKHNYITVGRDTFNYFIGGTYFAQKDYKKAIAYFQKAVVRPGTKLTDELNWYLAVSNDELRNTYLAIQYVNKIDEHPLKDKLLHRLQGIIEDNK